ncbi:MAG TPA: hypothetical protein VE029_01925 [Rhizobacter sp.]|nr:hypothetical protein [Rhizobacter sp.]
MNTTKPESIRADLTVVLMLARLLQRLDHSAVAVDADQYQTVVRSLANELQSVPSDATLRALLDGHPAAAELYENINYQHAGLCRSPLDAALNAELQARQTIDQVGRLASPNARGRG